MTTPLALICFENLLLGNQLANRLQDLGYRVFTIHDAKTLEEDAKREKPLLLIVDLDATRGEACDAIRRVKKNPDTAHLPVLAFSTRKEKKVREAAQAAGADLVAGQQAILEQLPRLLDQVLDVE